MINQYKNQAKFLMLFALRGRRHHNFNLAADMKKAMCFNDVVFESLDSEKENARLTWHFLQVKYTSKNKQLQLKHLKSNALFSLTTRFEAYCNIKKEELFKNPPSSHKFVVVTNRQSDLDGKEVEVDGTVCSIELVTFGEDDILFFQSGQNILFGAKKYKLKRKTPSINNEELIDSFLDEFFIVTDYPGEEELAELITNELSDLFEINKQMTRRYVYASLEQQMLDICSETVRVYYAKQDVDAFIEDVRQTFGENLSDSTQTSQQQNEKTLWNR